MDVLTIGSRVWVKDPEEAWVKAEVLKVDAGNALLRLEDSKQERKVVSSECFLQNPGNRGVEDMTTLSYLNEPGVLWNLKSRYTYDDIYTYTGSILIAINPFAPLPHLYGTHMMEQYNGVQLGELSPHVYAIADAAYRQMREEKKSQSILVSGESGAGKTETSKLIMQYLAWMGGYMNGVDTDSQGIEQQILESNPLLEAFGNAKTVRNANSSRFGKFVEIQFNKEGRISGAAVRTYLLERSRVVQVADPERNYHAFYQLCDGASDEERAAFKLKSAKDFHYLKQSQCFDLPGLSNAEEYKRTRRAMTLVGLTEDEQLSVFRTVAAVLHLGNVAFKEGTDSDSSAIKDADSEHHLAAVAELLGVDAAGLRHALTTRTRITHDGPIVSPIDVRAAIANRDSFAKMIYSRMFDWLVEKVNVAIGQDPAPAAVVGVLDIYGFESFQQNDFEQFCINLANEKLQQHFNRHVFKEEQKQYVQEEIDWSYITFEDNQDVLDLIEDKMGILALLDELCRFPRATHQDLANKLYTTTTVSESGRFSKPKLSQTDFTIAHYAGPVTYRTDNFLDKNKDFVVAEQQELLGNSTYAFVRSLFPADAAPEDGKAVGKAQVKFASVGSRFKGQLADLMTALNAMEPHYIRCIKPNSFNRPSDFENNNVLHQLRCGGVLEAVRISCAGFPTKVPYEDFMDRFWNLKPELYQDGQETDFARAVIKDASLQGYQLGKTKVFLRAGQMAQLDKIRTDKLHGAATVIQRNVRMWLAGVKYRRARRAVVVLQAGARGMLARGDARRARRLRATLLIQSYVRMAAARAEYVRARQAAVCIQAAYKGHRTRVYCKDIKRQRAALAIQTAWRRHRAQIYLHTWQRSVIALQCRWRQKLAKRELRRRRTEAREATKLLQDKAALEGRMQELQSLVETLQGQRNELKQSFKDEKQHRETLEAQLAAATAAHATELAAAVAAARESAVADNSIRTQLETQLSEVQGALETHKRDADMQRMKLEAELKGAYAKIAASEKAKQDLEASKNAQVKDLMTRLQNAVNQRNAAREEALMAGEKLKKLEEEMESGRLVASPGGAAAGAAAGMGPTPDAGMMDRVRQYISAGPSLSPSGLLRGREGVSPQGATPASITPRGSIMRMRFAEGGDLMTPEEGELSEAERRKRELQAKQQQLLREQRAADQERLLACITENLGYHQNRPVAAVIIFRCCLQWKAFQADRTSLFDKIINTMGGQIEKQQDDNACLAYWLSNTSTLLFLLMKNIKPATSGSYTSRLARSPAGASSRSLFGNKGTFTSFFSRSGYAPPASPGGEASIHGGGAGGFKQVEAKYPALLFKQQLDAFVQKIFPMLRDNVKKEITPQLAACIHAPKSSHRAAARPRPGEAPVVTQLSPHWGHILAVFDVLLDTLRRNHVPPFLVRKLFQQLFSFVNVQLFNQLLLRRECCSFSNGEYVKTGLAEVEMWIAKAGSDWVGESWEELKYIRQAVTFLVIHQKNRKTLEEITNDLCPVLSVQQLYRISTMYWDDRYGTETVSTEVLNRMKQLMMDNNTTASHSFLLDDDSSIPFTPEDVANLMDDKELYADIPVPQSLPEKSFQFLQRPLTQIG